MPDTAPDTPPATQPTPGAWLVDVEERSSYVVRIEHATLGLPADAPATEVTEALRLAADLMVSNGHTNAVRHNAEREVGDIFPAG